MSKLGTILLTSTGLYSDNVRLKFENIRDAKNLKKAIIVTTASSGKENNQYVQSAVSELKSTGLDMVDFMILKKTEKKIFPDMILFM